MLPLGATSYTEPSAGYMSKFNDLNAANDIAEITIYDNGVIKSCSAAATELLCCAPTVLLLRHISRVLPQLKDVVLVVGDRVNPHLRFLSRVGHHFEVVTVTGSRFLCALFFNDVEDFGRHCMRIIFRPVSALQ